MDNRNGNINKAQLLSCLKQVRDQLHDQAPLIHCITHPIVVNDCANAVLALGGRPRSGGHFCQRSCPYRQPWKYYRCKG